MVVDVKQQQTALWASQAFERIRRDGLTPTPNNYALMYYYFAGTNPKLRVAIDNVYSQINSLSQDHCDDLYLHYLGVDAEQKILRETNAAIEKEVSRVLDVIDRAANDTSQYSKTLDNFSGQLSQSFSLEQIREAVTKVAQETRSITRQNERLSEQLSQATQQLTDLRYNFDMAHRELQIDPLTEIGNRKFFESQLIYAMREARDNNAILSMLMIDIDHFKKFNDTYGHVVGDQVLRLVARTLVENLKGRDTIARYGGEEFVILLPMTKLEDAERVANHLRNSLAAKRVKKRSTNETLGAVTISIGVAEFCIGEDREAFIVRADSALYRAKNNGRNRTVCDILTPQQINEIKTKNYVPLSPKE